MFKNIDAVLFDLDGTLIDSAPDLGAAVDKMRTDRGLTSLSLTQYRHMAGAGARGMIEIGFGLKPEDAEFNALRDEFFVNYEACMTQRTYTFDGVSELIAKINVAGFRWGVVTNKSVRFTFPLTSMMPLFSTALTIISGDTTPYSKPHPEPLFEAARQLNILPERCVYVGDDERDILAGRAAGMKTVAAAYGYLGSVTSIRNWNADATIVSPLSLLNLLGIA